MVPVTVVTKAAWGFSIQSLHSEKHAGRPAKRLLKAARFQTKLESVERFL
jgi:hypothetical protein